MHRTNAIVPDSPPACSLLQVWLGEWKPERITTVSNARAQRPGVRAKRKAARAGPRKPLARAPPDPAGSSDLPEVVGRGKWMGGASKFREKKNPVD